MGIFVYKVGDGIIDEIYLEMARKLATLTGCNYKDTPQELSWPINNVYAWRDMLLSRFNFKRDDVKLLTDTSGSLGRPTRDNILAALNHMIDVAEAGDVLFFHFSGHGKLAATHVAIVPSGADLITDRDLRQLVDRVPKGASFIVLADCSHSGGLIAREKVQIGPNSPLPPHPDDAGILLSACQAEENASEILAPVLDRPYGAFTYAIKTVLEGHPGALTNTDLINLARDEMQRPHQHPCLYCSDDNAQAPFLCEGT